MPLMPAPPMPTKCTRLTLCFIAICASSMHASATRSVASVRRDAGARRSPSPAGAPASHRGSRSARRPAVSSACGITAAAPASTRNFALCVCSSAIAPGKRHDHAAHADGGESRRPSSAPPRQMTRSALRVAARHVVDERHAFAPRRRPPRRRAQRIDVRLARLMHDLRPRLRSEQRERRRHAFVQRRRRPRLPPTTSRLERPAATGEALLRRRDRDDLVAQRIADPLDLRCVPAAAARREIREGCDRRRRRACDWRVPRRAFASWITSGRPHATPISAPGNDAKPPKPSTTSGRTPTDDAEAFAETPARSANGPSSSRADPLPRTPAKRMPSKSTPCCGTSLDFHALARAEPEHAPVRGARAAPRPRGRETCGRRCRRW